VKPRSGILLTIMFGPFLSMLDSGIVNVGLPSMAAEFHTTPGGIQWVASVYLLSISALLPVLGSLADQIGRKKIFNLGFLVLGVFSLLSTWAPNLPMLVFSRVLQGLGGAMIIANGMALATEHHPASQRGRNLGLLTTVGAFGSIVGPVLGGLLIGFSGWRTVFYLSAIVAFAGWIASAINIPRDAKSGEDKFTLDGLGALLLAGSIAAFGLGLSTSWLLTLVSAVLLGFFLLWEPRARHPILRLELFESPGFLTAWVLSLVTFLALYAPTVLVPFYFQSVQGWSPGMTGLAMMAFPVAMALVSPLSGKLSDRYGVVVPTTVGLGLGVAGLLILACVQPSWSPLAVIGALALLGLALGAFQSPNNSSLMGSAPKALLGSATGFTQLARNLGTAAGISLSGTAFAALHGPASTLDAVAFYPSAAVIYGVAAGVLFLAMVFSASRVIQRHK